jgi:type II secretory ATPase GspE/PulE/Tfp pilus assembly ATPase PilB-like protein
MFSEDVELPLTIPAMSTARICDLLGDLWTAHEARLRRQESVSLSYRSNGLGTFTITLAQPDESRLEVRLRRDGTEARPYDEAAARHFTRDAVTGAATAAIDESAPLPAALKALLARAVSQGASDIHLSPQRPPIARINGTLQVLEGEAGLDATALLDTGARLERVQAGASVDRAVDLPGIGRVRVNVYASDEGLCAAVRILRREVPPLAELNLPAQIATLVELPHGLVIACGPTGSGKSTTLAALIQHSLRAWPQVLITLEDPIEYLIRPLHPAGLVRQRRGNGALGIRHAP